MKYWVSVFFFLLTTVSLSGCDLFSAPFSVEGEYTGSWSLAVTVPGIDQSIQNCKLNVHLNPIEASSGFELPKVSGTLTFFFDCITSPIPINIAPLDVPITGTISSNGTLQLDSADLDSHCNKDVCLQVKLKAQGKDIDENSMMDSFSGEVTGRISGALIEELAGSGIDLSNGVPVSGTLTAARVSAL